MNLPDFRSFFESTPDMYLILAPDLEIIGVNDAYLKATMREREEITGRNVFDVFPDNPNDPAAEGMGSVKASFERMFKNKTPDAMPLLKYDLQIPGSDEFEERYWSVLNTPVMDENRRIKYIIQRGEDVTEFVRLKKKDREQSEIWEGIQKTQKDYVKQLRDNEEKFRLLVERAKDYAIFMVDLTGHVQTWNEGAQKIKGYNADEIIGKHISVFYSEEARKNREPEENLRIAKEKGSYENEGWRVRKDGTRFWADVIYTTLYDEGGNLKGYSKITRDLTEKKLAEDKINNLNKELESKIQQINESEEKFKKIFLANATGISITKVSDNTFADANDAYVELTGYSKEELSGHSAEEIGLVVDIEKRKYILDEILVNGSAKDVEMTLRRKSGKTMYVLASVEQILLHGEKHRINIIYDITERKRAEEQLQLLNKELEAFSYSVSHDLRAPLRAIDGYAQILNEDYNSVLDKEGQRVLQTIVYSVNQMGTLIDELLAFSKLGRKELHKSEINMNELVESVKAEIGKSSGNNARVKIGDLPNVNGDYSLLHQVMYNLLSNAVKYSSKKTSPLIEVFSEEINDEIIFSVKDNGAGFDMEYADKLFGVFQRLHSEEEFEGTGVGLAIVQRVISKHGGRVWAEGKVNEGAIFHFSLTKN